MQVFWEESQECDQVFGHVLPETPALGYADLNGTTDQNFQYTFIFPSPRAASCGFIGFHKHQPAEGQGIPLIQDRSNQVTMVPKDEHRHCQRLNDEILSASSPAQLKSH